MIVRWWLFGVFLSGLKERQQWARIVMIVEAVQSIENVVLTMVMGVAVMVMTTVVVMVMVTAAGRRADVVSLRSRGPITDLIPQRPWRWFVFKLRWGWIEKQQTIIRNLFLVPSVTTASPCLASPCLVCRTTQSVMSGGTELGVFVLPVCVAAGLGREARLMGETPAPPTLPLLDRATPQPTLARQTVPCQLSLQNITV
ncbi:hypothetical protein E2C01_008536 [Portunus trituberculatus]|uniref:Uncharacterized protein n=1 Tax=Portunus trituberculatus TaxID=210409 RepID=A0A5B7D341_PORTR|nr:hypothetical protein [Portunus trituberculatus]